MVHKTGTPNSKPQVATDLIERNKKLSDPMTEEWYENKHSIDFKMLDKEIKNWESATTEVIKELRKRECVGLQKYGKSLNKHTTEDMMQHLLEELLDAACYIKTEMMKRNNG